MRWVVINLHDLLLWVPISFNTPLTRPLLPYPERFQKSEPTKQSARSAHTSQLHHFEKSPTSPNSFLDSHLVDVVARLQECQVKMKGLRPSPLNCEGCRGGYGKEGSREARQITSMKYNGESKYQKRRRQGVKPLTRFPYENCWRSVGRNPLKIAR